MKAWDTFYDHYLADIDGCTFFAAANELRQAAREFCSRSHAWRVELDPVQTITDVSRYEFDRTAQMEVVKLMSAKLGGQKIEPILYDADPTQRGIVALSPMEFELRPAPPAGLVVALVAICQPGQEATGVDDVLYAMYAREIAYGARAKLFARANKTYSNAALADKFERMFDESIARARTKAAKSYSSAPLRTAASFM